jgi:hypothetical protein
MKIHRLPQWSRTSGPLPGPGGKWQISSGAGLLAKWSHTSKELFYRTTDQKIMVTTYAANEESVRNHEKTIPSTSTPPDVVRDVVVTFKRAPLFE